MSTKIHKIIDGDGHVVEDHAAIGTRMPDEYRDRFESAGSLPAQ